MSNQQQQTLTTSRLTSFEQVSWMLAPPSGRHRPLTAAQTSHTYVAFDDRPRVTAFANIIAERYHFRLTEHGLVLTVLRNGRPVPSFGPVLLHFGLIKSIKFYYDESRIRLLFRQSALPALVDEDGERLLQLNPLQSLLLESSFAGLIVGRQSRSLYMTFLSESERLRLLLGLRLARLIDFRRSPAPAPGGFTIAFPVNGSADVLGGGIINEGFEHDEEEDEEGEEEEEEGSSFESAGSSFSLMSFLSSSSNDEDDEDGQQGPLPNMDRNNNVLFPADGNH